jgi:hypothetical protein
VPHERSLVRRLEGKPFVLLGINVDEDRQEGLTFVREHDLRWRSWWDGGTEGPIARRWGIYAWPVTYVLDGRGIIRFQNVWEKDLDRAVDLLLDERSR